MRCKCCHIAKTFPGYRMFCPSCLWCGARLIQALGQLEIPAAEISKRRRAVLEDWMSHGHDEQAIRTLVMGRTAIGPDRISECDGPTPKKPPSVGQK